MVAQCSVGARPSSWTCYLCQGLQYDSTLNDLIQLASKSNSETQYVNLDLLGYEPLINKIMEKNRKSDQDGLKSFNMGKQLGRLIARHQLHRRFMLSLSEDNVRVPRIHALVYQALKHKRGMAHIMEKLSLAINKHYHPKSFTADDYELASLVAT